MNINDAFPSRYLGQDDLRNDQGVAREITLIISHVTFEEVDKDSGDTKPVVFFNGAKKGWILGKGTFMAICEMHGLDSDAWAGKAVTLFIDTAVMYQGKRTGGVRVKAQAQEAAYQPQGQPTPHPGPAPVYTPSNGQPGAPPPTNPGAERAEDLDDEIPF